MYKNQLQELAQRSCFNLPSYTCIREGPDHAPRFKVVVNFNGELFESPNFCTTLRQAEHSAAEVALRSLSSRAPSHSLAAKILDETGVYKNLLQEISQRVGARLPSYTTFRSGLGHLPVFTCTVELAGITFTGEPAKNKKQAEKNAAMAAWSSLKKLAKQETSSSSDMIESNDEQEQITIARALLKYRLKEKMMMINNPNASPFPKKFPLQPDKKPSSMQSSSYAGSKILPLIHTQLAPRIRSPSPVPHNERALALATSLSSSSLQHADSCANSMRPSKFPATGATPYVPVHQYRSPSPFSCSVAPPVTMRTAVPVFSAPPASNRQFQPFSPPVHIAPPVQIRQTVPAFAAAPKSTAPPPVRIQGKQPGFIAAVKQEQLLTTILPTGASSSAVADPRTGIKTSWAVDASKQLFPPSSAPLPSASSALIETDREHGQNALVEDDDDLLQQSDMIHTLEKLLI